MTNLLLTCFLISFSTHMASSFGVFELKVHSFNSTRNICKQSQDCKIFFHVCLKHAQAVIVPGPPCIYGEARTETFSLRQGTVSSAPIRVPLRFKWPGTFSLIIEALNAQPSSDPSTAICSSGCSGKHGYCEAPGECKCRLGWQGPLCDECVRYPGCLHGTCGQPWQCHCKEGWGGLFCNQDLNFCTNHKPCMNDATCTNTGQGSYTCACKPGFSGVNCEIETNECDSNPCKNGGSCNDMENDYSCTCPQGFYGKNCEISAMTCADGPCFHGGTCMETASGGEGEVGGYSCHCPPGYMGSNCEKKMDRCSSDPCANGGQCLDLGHSLKCRCRPGFKGPRCEIDVDECARRPCRNAGTCTDGVNDYTCTCPLGFTGKDCGLRVDACSLFACANGGTCYAHISGPVCQCPAGFMGTRCEFSLQTTRRPTTRQSAIPAALAISCTLGLLTLTLVVCAAVVVLGQMRRGRKATATSVRNDLETINNLTSVTTVTTASTQPSLREKEAFLIPGGQYKVSNKDAALSWSTKDVCGDNISYKNRTMDYNLAKEDRHGKNKLDAKNSETSILVPPVSFPKEGLYHPVYVIPEQMEQCVFATEV